MADVCTTGSFPPEVNQTFEKAIETALSTPDNPVDIPDGSSICLKEDGSISTYKSTLNTYSTDYYFYNFSPSNENTSSTKKIEQAIIVEKDGKKEPIMVHIYHHTANLKAEPANLKSAGELIKMQAVNEQAYKKLLESLVRFVGA